jgi:N-acetylglutamate synthase-like GNAT family acetyltransferase
MEIITYQDKYLEAVRDLIYGIKEKEFGERGKNHPDLLNISEFYQKTERANFWLAFENDKLVGTIGLNELSPDIGYFSRFYVHKDYRRKGIGSKLFYTLTEFAKKHDYKKIFLNTSSDQVAANKFYVKMGFTRVYSFPKELPYTPTNGTFYEMHF